MHPVKIIAFAAAVGCFALAGFVAQADTITWTNAASGGWNTAANWNPNAVPGAADTAIITNPGVTVSLNGATTVGAVILGTAGPGTVTLTLAGQTLALNGPLTVNPSGSFTVDGGSLVGNTNAVLNGTIGWSAGILGGFLTLSSGSTLTLTNGNNHDIPNCTFTNNGTVLWANGVIRGGGNPGTTIYNYGLWDAQGDQTLNKGYGGSGTAFNNFGTFRKSGSAGGNTTFVAGTAFNQLAGQLDSQTNSVVLSGGGNFTGGTATNLAGLIILNGGSFNINGTVTSTNVQFAGATLVGTNVISGGLNWMAGLWNGTSDTIDTNTTLLITTANNHDVADCTFTNNGTVVWASGIIRGGDNPGTIIYNYGLWDAQSDQTLSKDYGGNGTAFNNAGTFRKSGSTGGNTTFVAGTTFNQLAGKLDSQTNSIVLTGGGNFTGGTATNLAGLIILNGGSFNLNGTVTSTNVQFAGATLTGTNVVSGGLNWMAGLWNGTSDTIATNTTLLITTANNHDVADCTFTNNGTVVWANGAIRGGDNPGTMIYNYGLWDAQSDQTFIDSYGGNGTVFKNFGTLRKSAGAKPASTTFDGKTAFMNAGTLDVQNGLMLFSGSFTNSACTLAVENGATLQIAQPVILSGGLVTGSGTVQLPSLTSSALVNPGATNAVLTIAGNYTQLLGGSMQFDIGGTLPGVNQSQVNVTGSASLNGMIALRFSPGYIPAVASSNLVLTAGSQGGKFSFQDHFYLLGQNKRIDPVYSPTNLVLLTITAADPTNIFLSAGLQGQTFALAWPSEFAGYQLYENTNLTSPNWTIVPGVTNFYTEIPPATPHKFFTLRATP